MEDMYQIWENRIWNMVNWAERNGILARDTHHTIAEADLRTTMERWANETGDAPLRGAVFRTTLNRMGYPKGPAHNYIRTRVGLRLIRPTTTDRAKAVAVANAILFS